MLDPERLTFAQWFWVCFIIVVSIFFLCRCVDLNSSEEPLSQIPGHTAWLCQLR